VQRRADVIDGLTREEAPESKVDDRLASKRSLHLEPVVVGIDETQTYFEEAPEKLRNEFVELVTYLVKKGPALGVIVILATQQVTAETIPTSISNNAVIRFCMKVEGGFQPNDQILGTGAYSRGVDANMLDIDDEGIGYLKAEGTKPRIVRSVWGLDAVASERIALRARQLRVDAGMLVGQAAGDELEREADQVNLLAELRDIFGARTLGVGGCWSGVIATPVSWRSTVATPRSWCHCASWSALPGAAGRWRSRSRPVKGWPGSTSIRFVVGPPGSAGPCWPLPPTPYWS
jgi:S-DNA-T family DNA segregation ATPase FtsK/SpoIIIE